MSRYLVTGIALVLTVAFAPCWLPAQRARHVDPVRVLGVE